MDKTADQSNSSAKKLFLNGNLQIIFGITLIAVLGVSSITPAFPVMKKVLNVSEQEIGLLITFFTLPGVFLTPVLGVLADRLGRKKILIPSLFLFAIAGTMCFFVNDFILLLILRFVQGIGGASLGSLNVTLIGDLFKGNERASAMGYNASVLSVGTASYPAIGGALAVVGWNYPFLLPILAVPVGLFSLKLHNPEPHSNQKLKEYLSSTLASIKNKKVIGLLLASVITFIILYGAFLTYFPFLVQQKFRASTFIIGLLMSVMSVTTAIVSSQLGKLVQKFSEASLLKASFIFYGISMLLMSYMPNIYLLIIPIVIFGLGQGVNVPSIQNLLAAMAPMNYRGAFMSLNGTVLRLGQTLGPLIMGLILGVWGIHFVFIMGAFFAAIMFVAAFILIND